MTARQRPVRHEWTTGVPWEAVIAILGRPEVRAEPESATMRIGAGEPTQAHRTPQDVGVS